MGVKRVMDRSLADKKVEHAVLNARRSSSTVQCWIESVLSCPIDGAGFNRDDGYLVCGRGHRWLIVGGVPVLLRDDGWPGSLADSLWVESRPCASG